MLACLAYFIGGCYNHYGGQLWEVTELRSCVKVEVDVLGSRP